MYTTRNITIDDQLGDENTGQIPLYTPDSAWATQACKSCAIKPNILEMFDHTFTAATFMPDKNMTSNSIEFTFNGTAVYIFFTLFNFEGPGVTVNTECNFMIDDRHMKHFSHTGNSSLPYERDYRVPVFSKTDLEQRSHRMKISMSDVNYHVFLSFDYAIYTQLENDGNPKPLESLESPSNHIPVGAVVGGVLGGLCILLGFVALFRLCRSSRRKQTATQNNIPDPVRDPVPDLSVIVAIPRPLPPGPVKQRLIPISPPHSIHGGSTITSGIDSPQHSPTSSISLDADHERLVPEGHSNRGNRKGSTHRHRHYQVATYTDITRSESSREARGLNEEVRRLREELTSLQRDVKTGQLALNPYSLV